MPPFDELQAMRDRLQGLTRDIFKHISPASHNAVEGLLNGYRALVRSIVEEEQRRIMRARTVVEEAHTTNVEEVAMGLCAKYSGDRVPFSCRYDTETSSWTIHTYRA